MSKSVRQQILAEARKKEIKAATWYNLRPMMGYFNWAMLLVLLGGRDLGKSYAVLNYNLDSFFKKGIPFTWLRLTQTQIDGLLEHNAEKLCDPDLYKKYFSDNGLCLKTAGNNVYCCKVEKKEIKQKDGSIKIKEVEVERKLMCRVFALSNFYNQKGNGLFDKDFLNDLTMQYHIILDEFEKEEGEKSQGDILYQFVNQIENLIRDTKTRVKIFMIGNTLDTCADILVGLNFLPEKFGTYKLKSKRTVIDYVEPSEGYIKRRKGSFADLLMPNASTFTNKAKVSNAPLYDGRVITPKAIIKFTTDEDTWFTVWDSGIIHRYNKEKCKRVIAMRRYIDEVYTLEDMNNIVQLFDTRSFRYKNLVTFALFQKHISYIKPKK